MAGLWKKQNFTNQLIIMFMITFLIQVGLGQVLNGYLLSSEVQDKIVTSNRQLLKQTTENIQNSLNRYQDLVEQVINDPDFHRGIQRFDRVEGNDVQDALSELEAMMKNVMSFQERIRCFTIHTAGGAMLGFAQMQKDMIYENVNQQHADWYKEEALQSTTIIKGRWFPTHYLSRWGTKDYYGFSFGRIIRDWNYGRYIGEFLVSFDESVLSDICATAQVSAEKNLVYVLDKNGLIISCPDKQMLGSSIFDQEGWTFQDGLFYAGDKYITSSEYLKDPGWYVVSILEKDYIYDALRTDRLMMLAISAVLAVLVSIAVILVSRRLSLDVKKIVRVMKDVEDGQLSAKIGFDKHETNEISVIANQFDTMMDQINEQMVEIQNAGKRERDAEIRALEAQINPHFIYNTLDSINWVAIENGQQQISEMLSSFAEILRYQIRESNALVTIGQEIEYLEKYLFLQKSRFLDSFEYLIECDKDLYEYKIYKLIFQPFVENAIIHGCAEIDYGGLIKVQVSEDGDDSLQFVISDNGKGMSAEQIDQVFGMHDASSGIGVANVLARLKMYYGEHFRISVNSSPETGTVITAVIPKTL